MPEEVRQKMLGSKLSKRHRENLSKALLGRGVSDETRQKISRAKKNKPRKPHSEL